MPLFLYLYLSPLSPPPTLSPLTFLYLLIRATDLLRFRLHSTNTTREFQGKFLEKCSTMETSNLHVLWRLSNKLGERDRWQSLVGSYELNQFGKGPSVQYGKQSLPESVRARSELVSDWGK